MIAFVIGLILLIIGTVRAVKEERLGKFVGEMLAGLFFLGLGVVLTSELIKGNVRGVYVVGFIPIPLIVVTPIVGLAGLYFFVEGTVSLFKRRPSPFRGRRKIFRK